MEFEMARRLYGQIDATKLLRLNQELLIAAARYARVRADWRLANAAERREMGRRRTAAHEALIDACNILSRDMAEASEDKSWCAVLGDARKEIGDLACFVHCIQGIAAR